MATRDAEPGRETPGLLKVARNALLPGPTASVPKADSYRAYYDGALEDRQREYAAVVNTYYDLVTDFFEYGWGQSFHFAPRARGESLRESIIRSEHWLALCLGLTPESRVLDVGCGVGGPMRSIARFAGCHITGLNNNAYQIERLGLLNHGAGLAALCDGVKGDFMAMPFADSQFDMAYAIEATVHAPKLAGVYAEIARVLRPGGLFASYEWTMTDRFDPAKPEHRRLRSGIEYTNGITHLSTEAEVRSAIAEAGLELVRMEDRCATADIPWYEPLAPSSNPIALRRTSGLGKHFTTVSMHVLEGLRIAPRGTTEVARLLARGGEALVAGGRLGIFTPDMLVLARKPAG